MEQLLVPRLIDEKKKEYEKLVLEIVESFNSRKDYSSLTQKIDRLIYQEIGLSKEEIDFIESQ